MLGKTPYELLVYSIPDYYDHVLVFGCLCCTSTATINWKQFDTPGRCCVFLSYACGIKGINCLTLNIKKFLFPRKLFSGSIFSFHDSHNQRAPIDHFDIYPNTHDSLVLPHSILMSIMMTLHHKNLPLLYELGVHHPLLSIQESTRIRKTPAYLNDYHCHM